MIVPLLYSSCQSAQASQLRVIRIGLALGETIPPLTHIAVNLRNELGGFNLSVIDPFRIKHLDRIAILVFLLLVLLVVDDVVVEEQSSRSYFST